MIAWVITISHVLGALTSVRAVMEVRTPQGTIGWVVALNAMPYISVPAYWVFGRSKFQGYVNTRRAELAKTDPTARTYIKKLVERDLLAEPDRESAALVEKLAKLPYNSGNDVELLVDGAATFASIFSGIDSAEHYVLVEFYILRDDELGRELKDRLIAKAKLGLDVYLVYDEMGSKDLPDSFVEELQNANVKVYPFNTTKGKTNRWQLNFRNHRKIVVVDGNQVWVGGHNVGDEYLGRDATFGSWRDTHVKVVGPAAQSIQMAFLEDWHWASGEILDLAWEPKSATASSA